jgi:hypothetical protein
MHLVHNERTKLTAAWFNAIATALIAAGTFAPVAALVYGLTAPGRETIYLLVLAAICVGASVALHFFGRIMLGRLRE